MNIVLKILLIFVTLIPLYKMGHNAKKQQFERTRHGRKNDNSTVYKNGRQNKENRDYRLNGNKINKDITALNRKLDISHPEDFTENTTNPW